MLILLFATVKLIQTCEYHCQTCDSLQEICSSCPATRILNIDEKGVKLCLCQQNFVDIGGQECLQCPSNCVNCDPHDPSKCISCGDEELTHRVLDNNQVCVCKEGYTEVWYTYNCQDMQFNQQILQFQYILSLDEYINRLQNKYSYSQLTIQGLDYMIQSGLVNNGSNSYQLISKLESNKIISTTTPYPLGQSYMEKFDNLFAWGIKLNHGSTMVWAANIHYSFYQQYSGMRIVNQNQWEFVIYQFLIQKYEGNVFLQIALSENKNVNSENQNRLLDTTEGNMALCYYLAYEYNGFLFNLKLEEIIDDILYILLQRPSNSLDYFYNGQKLAIKQCQPNYILKNEECICDNENGYSLYNNICQLQCPIDCITCTKEVCLLADHSIRCQENYYLDAELNICLQCSQTCSTCINEKECTKCKSGLILSNNQCLTCQEFSKQRNCEQYDNNCLCKKCVDGYQLDQIDQCIQCSPNCKFCNFKDQCNICKDGYYLINDSCIQCHENCMLCSDLNYCVQSKIGYYVQNGIALQCTNNCLVFFNECQCQDCPNKYYRDDIDLFCYSCPVNCDVCTNKQTCTNCISNSFYLDNFECKECQFPCLTCLSQTKCLSCIDEQHYYIKEQQNCILCPPPCQTCYYDESPLCISCLGKHYLFNQQCYECPLFCKDTCNYDAINILIQCEQCQTGFYPSQIGIPFECRKCKEHCISCTNEELCLECSQGYILKNGKCQSCNQLYSNQCISCNNQLCLNCQNGYKLINGNCIEDIISVVPICLTKKEYYNIIEQKIGNLFQIQLMKIYIFFSVIFNLLNKNIKLAQLKQQKDSHSSVRQQKHFDNILFIYTYYIFNYQINNTISNSCDSCILNCINCTTSATCIRCEEQYYQKSEICIPCKFPCNNCLSDQFCQTISTQQYYIDFTITEVNQINSFRCISPCRNCYSIEDCIDCIDGFYFDNTNKCLPCDSPCKTCKNLSTFCISCNSGFQLLNGICYQCLDQNCQNCNQFCQSCNHLKDDFYKCQQCLPGYYLINQECHQCNSSCQSCSTQSDYCTSCPEGYFLTIEMKCEKCNLGCKSCQVQTKSCNDIKQQQQEEIICTLCEDGYYLSEMSDFIYQCVKCDQECKSCEEGACLVCTDSYYLTEEKKCQKCVLPCLKCISLTQCTFCENGYYLNNEKCERCQDNCLKCTSSNDCLICQNSYQLVDNKCIKCSNNCITCNKDQCQQCELGYFLQNDGYCHQNYIICNINSCSQCLSANQCLSCSAGYTLNTTNNECRIEQQIQNTVSNDESDSGIDIIIASSIFSIISLTIIYFIRKCIKINIQIKLKNRNEPKYPELPVTESESPVDYQI